MHCFDDCSQVAYLAEVCLAGPNILGLWQLAVVPTGDPTKTELSAVTS